MEHQRQPQQLVDRLCSSPEALLQLLQQLKATPNNVQEPAHAAPPPPQQPVLPTAGDTSLRDILSGAGAALLAASLQAPASAAKLAVPQQHLQVPPSLHQQLGALLGAQLTAADTGSPSASQQQCTTTNNGAAAAAQIKQLLSRMLGQQQPAQQQLQPQMVPQAEPARAQPVEQCWGAPSPHSNNSATVSQHSILPAAGLHALQGQLQQAPAQAPQPQDNLMQHLRSSLADILRSVSQQQPAAVAPLQQPAVPQPQPRPACGMPGQINVAALAAAMGFDMTQDMHSSGLCGPVAPQPAAPRPAHPMANGAAHSYAPGGMQLLPQQPPQQQPQQPRYEEPQQQGNGTNMPALLDRLRAAVISSTAPSNGGPAHTPEQQQLLGIVDQLQSAWASLGRDTAAGQPRASTGDATARTALAAGGPQDAMAAAAAAVEAEGLPDASGLFMLLEAVQQQVAEAAAASAPGLDAAPQGYGGAMGLGDAACGWAEAAYLDGAYLDPGMEYEQQQLYSPQQGPAGGGSRRKRGRAAESSQQQQQQESQAGGLAAAVAAMMRQEGMSVGVDASVEEQKFLLKPRARGKRQVKPNKVALTGELPPVFDRWASKGAQQQRSAPAAAAAGAAAGAASSDEDELWRPPRARAAAKRRRVQGGHGSDDGAAAGSEDTSQGHAQQAAGSEGRGGGAAAARRGYGWQLLQQQQGAGGGSQPEDGAEGPSCSDSGMEAAAAGAEVTGDAGSADGAGSKGVAAAGSASAATGSASGVTKPRSKPAPRKDRWVPPTEEWTSDDGIKVWPKDTQICSGARVFYVAYKWVEDHWPDNLASPDNHITQHPIRFYLDGVDTQVELTAKLRLYRKAVHLVISPYSALAKKFVRKWLAGYAFDPERQLLRAYLSTLKPKPPKLQVEEADPAEFTAAAAAAAECCNTALAQFAAGPLALDAKQQLAAQLAALANMLQPKVKATKDAKRGAAGQAKLPALQRPTEAQQGAAEGGPETGAQAEAEAGAQPGTEAEAGAQQQEAPQQQEAEAEEQQPAPAPAVPLPASMSLQETVQQQLQALIAQQQQQAVAAANVAEAPQQDAHNGSPAASDQLAALLAGSGDAQVQLLGAEAAVSQPPQPAPSCSQQLEQQQQQLLSLPQGPPASGDALMVPVIGLQGGGPQAPLQAPPALAVATQH